MIRPLFPCILAGLLFAADTPPPTPQALMADLVAANEARAAVGREANAWDHERARIQALVDAITEERDRLTAEAERLATATADLEAERRRLGDSSDLDAVRADLDASATAVREALQALAVQVPPGTVDVPAAGGERAFDEAMRALDVSERAASQVVVEIVTGRRGQGDLAVKLLRAGGAAAWWESLDGSAGGIATMRDGMLILEDGDEALRQAVHQAILISEGRAPAGPVVLPLAPILVAGGAP